MNPRHAPRCLRSSPFSPAPAHAPRRCAARGSVAAELGQRRRLLRGVRPQLPGLGRRREGDLKGLISRLDYLNDGQSGHQHRPGGGRALADAGVRLAQLPRLRHRQLREDQPRLRHRRGLRPAARGGAQAGHQDRGRPGAQPHRGGSSWFVESAKSPTSAKRIGTCGAPPTSTGRSPGTTKVPPGTRGGAPSTTASSGRGCRTSTTARRRCARRSSAIAALWLKRGVDGFRLDAGAGAGT